VRIVVLDGYTLNPGDLDWKGLQTLGSCQIHDRTPPDLVICRAQDAEALLINKIELPGDVLTKLSCLKYIGVLATGYNVVDVRAAAELGIAVTNVPTYGTQSVAQMAFAHLLNLSQHVESHARGVRDGRWSASADWCYWDFPLVELAEKTMGVVGFGRIGRATARIAEAFGMRVLASDVTLSQADFPVRFVDLDTLFRESDVVSLHCPLTDETRGLVNAQRLAQMKPTALLINTSRGPLVDETALADALKHRTIAGAGLDVLSVEPPPENHPLLALPNCQITPHIAWATKASRARLMQTAVENLRAFVAGSPQNIVTASPGTSG
jgi:glycerate dehydrogenase